MEDQDNLVEELSNDLARAQSEVDDRDKRIDTLETALERIVQWAEAYPLDVFPEPDFKRVHEVLKAAGLGLDQVSASNMRHVVKGVGEIARSALGKGSDDV